MKKSKILKSVVVVLLGVILFGLTGCTDKVTKETDGDNNIQIQTNTVSKNDENESKSNNNSKLSKEEIVKKVYLNYIAEMATKENYKLSEYTVDKVQIVSWDEVKEFSPDIEQYYAGVKTSDIFAKVTYSVKPSDSMDKTYWIAGNGEIDGQWVKNKTANVWLVENNGEYTIESNGTEW